VEPIVDEFTQMTEAELKTEAGRLETMLAELRRNRNYFQQERVRHQCRICDAQHVYHLAGLSHFTSMHLMVESIQSDIHAGPNP